MNRARVLSWALGLIAFGCCVPSATGLVRTDGPALACMAGAITAAAACGWFAGMSKDARGGDRDA